MHGRAAGTGNVATRSYRGEIEARIPGLRRCARALTDGRDHADELVHDVLAHALKSERSWAGEDVTVRLFSRLVGVNRARLRSQVGERRSAPGYPAQSGAGAPGRPAFSPSDGSAQDDLFAGLSLNEREALIVVVLGGLDYPAAAQAVGVPVGVLVTRMVQARDKLGHGLWAARGFGRGTPARSTAHLRLVKS